MNVYVTNIKRHTLAQRVAKVPQDANCLQRDKSSKNQKHMEEASAKLARLKVTPATFRGNRMQV